MTSLLLGALLSAAMVPTSNMPRTTDTEYIALPELRFYKRLEPPSLGLSVSPNVFASNQLQANFKTASSAKLTRLLNLYWWDKELRRRGFVASRLNGFGIRVEEGLSVVFDGRLELRPDNGHQRERGRRSINRSYVVMAIEWYR